MSAPGLAIAAALCFGPFGSPEHPVTREALAPAASRPEQPDTTFLRLAFDFYRVVVSTTDGPRCAHRPSCSRYGLLAVREHGLWGLLLTIDRLLRADRSSAVRRLSSWSDGQQLYLLDPLEESTFWFASP